MRKTTKVLLGTLWLGGVGLWPLWTYLAAVTRYFSDTGRDSTGDVGVIAALLIVIPSCVITLVLTGIPLLVLVFSKATPRRRLGYAALAFTVLSTALYAVFAIPMRLAEHKDANYRAEQALAKDFARQVPAIAELIAGQRVELWVIGNRYARTPLSTDYRVCVLPEGAGKVSGPEVCLLLAVLDVKRIEGKPIFAVRCVAMESEQQSIIDKEWAAGRRWNRQTFDLCDPLAALRAGR